MWGDLLKKADRKMECAQLMKHGSVAEFTVSLSRRSGGSDNIGLGINFKKVKAYSVSGKFSIMVEEIGYVQNDMSFYDMYQGGYYGRHAFSDSLVDSLTKLSIRIATYFESKSDESD